MRRGRKDPPPVREGESVEAAIESLASGPDTVARARGFVLFVPGGVPGERVRVRVTEVGKRFGRGEIEAVLAPSADRVAPFCPLYASCGGCHLQHLGEEARRRTKEELLRKSLEHALGRPVPVSALVGPAAPRAYRDKVAFTLGHDMRRGLTAGFYRTRSRDLIPVDACPVQHEGATRLALALVDAHRSTGVQAWEPSRGTGDVSHVLVRAGQKTGELYGVVVAKHARLPWLDRVVERARSLGAVGLALNVSPPRERELVLGPETRILAGPPRYRTEIAGITYHVAPTSFFQTNAAGAEAIVANVLRALGDVKGRRVLDVYGGVGLIGLQVAKRGGRALVVEGNPASIADGRATAEANHLQASFRRGRAEDVVTRLAREGSRFDAVVVDPPREGCHDRVIAAIRDVLKPRTVVYVSCDPESLGRDLKRFEGYEVAEVVPIDMFPHAYPIEAVAVLRPS